MHSLCSNKQLALGTPQIGDLWELVPGAFCYVLDQRGLFIKEYELDEPVLLRTVDFTETNNS